MSVNFYHSSKLTNTLISRDFTHIKKTMVGRVSRFFMNSFIGFFNTLAADILNFFGYFFDEILSTVDFLRNLDKK